MEGGGLEGPLDGESVGLCVHSLQLWNVLLLMSNLRLCVDAINIEDF